MEISQSKGRVIRLFLIIVGIALPVIFIRIFISTPLFPSCLFHRFTGLYCPVCGSGRALHAISHFRFLEAISSNALFVAGLAFVIYLLIYEIVFIFFKKTIPKPKIGMAGLWIILGTIMLFWILRNIPVIPFIYLAP
jgi:hypothetical protein